jgi:hypothetical protein
VKNIFFNNKIKLFFKKHYPIIILVFIVLITHWRWVFLNEHFSSGDSAYFTWFVNTCRDIFRFPSIWSSLDVNTAGTGFGGLDVLLSWYPSLSMYTGLTILLQNTIIASKLAYLIPIPIISVIGSFLLVQYLLGNKMAGVIGSIVYSYNVHTLILQTGTIQWAMAYALAPLIIYLFIKSIDSKKLNLSVLTGLIGFVAGSYDFRILYIVAWVMLFYIIYQILFKIKDKTYAQIVPILQYIFIPFAIIFLLNFFWILPFYFSNTISHNPLFDRAIFGSQFVNLFQGLTLFHPYWTGHIISVFSVQPIPFYFWLIPIFALMGLITNFKNKKILFFSFIAILGILLAKQESYPFPHLYAWLYYHFPGFNAYREASKFYLLIALGYSVLIGFFAKSLVQIKIKNSLFLYARYFILAVMMGIFLWNARPLITGEVGRLFIPVKLPSDYRVLADFLDSDHQFSRTLWFPAYSKWSFFDNDHPRYTLYYNAYEWFLKFQKNPAYHAHIYNTTKILPVLSYNLELLNQSFSDNFLDITSTKYIIVPPQYKDIPDDDMFLGTSINDRPFIINFFDHLAFLKRINIGTKDMVVYENFNYKPLIYITSMMDNVYKAIPYKAVNYQYISPTEYLVEIKNISKPIYLNFNNSYAKDWTLDLGDGHYLPSKDHLQTNLQFNAFYINPIEITKNYDKKFYTKNTDGSISLKLKLYYQPQDLANIGTYISLAVFMSVFIYLFIDFFKVKDFALKQLKFRRKR